MWTTVCRSSLSPSLMAHVFCVRKKPTKTSHTVYLSWFIKVPYFAILLLMTITFFRKRQVHLRVSTSLIRDHSVKPIGTAHVRLSTARTASKLLRKRYSAKDSRSWTERRIGVFQLRLVVTYSITVVGSPISKVCLLAAACSHEIILSTFRLANFCVHSAELFPTLFCQLFGRRVSIDKSQLQSGLIC